MPEHALLDPHFWFGKKRRTGCALRDCIAANEWRAKYTTRQTHYKLLTKEGIINDDFVILYDTT